MTKFVRLAALAAAATLVATPAFAAPVSASPAAKARAKIVKPLTLTAVDALDFGTVVVGDLSGGPETVAVSLTSDTPTCGTNLTCTGGLRGQYHVTGTNQMDIKVRSGVTTLTNSTSGGSETLTFTPAVPADGDVNLGNSGAAGVNFYVGGTLTIASTTVDGLYEGDMDVTVDY